MDLIGFVIASVVLALAGLSKGITGMGIPVVAPPVRGIILMLTGGFGIVLGTFTLININPNILSGILGTIHLLFVTSSYLSILPRFAKSPPKWIDGIFGVFCGSLQGAVRGKWPACEYVFISGKH